LQERKSIYLFVYSFIQTFIRINADLQSRRFIATNRDTFRQCEAP